MSPTSKGFGSRSGGASASRVARAIRAPTAASIGASASSPEAGENNGLPTWMLNRTVLMLAVFLAVTTAQYYYFAASRTSERTAAVGQVLACWPLRTVAGERRFTKAAALELTDAAGQEGREYAYRAKMCIGDQCTGKPDKFYFDQLEGYVVSRQELLDRANKAYGRAGVEHMIEALANGHHADMVRQAVAFMDAGVFSWDRFSTSSMPRAQLMMTHYRNNFTVDVPVCAALPGPVAN